MKGIILNPPYTWDLRYYDLNIINEIIVQINRV